MPHTSVPAALLPPLTSAELLRYVPNFDCTVDPQVGEWILVTEKRLDALTLPLVKLFESQSLPKMLLASAVRRDEEGSAAEAKVARNTEHLASLFLPISEAYKRYSTTEGEDSHRRPEGAAGASAPLPEPYARNPAEFHLKGLAPQPNILYLHARAGLLVHTPPAVFGGSDYIVSNGLQSVGGKHIFVNWKTGDISSNPEVATTVDSLMPTWTQGLVQRGVEELFESLRGLKGGSHHTRDISVQNTDESDDIPHAKRPKVK